MDARDTVNDEMSGFEKLIDKLPVFGGYQDKEKRRDADKILRDHVAKEFDDQRRRLESYQKKMLSGGGLAYMDDVGQVTSKLHNLIDKIRTATRGYAGFFDAVKVKEEELDALYNFDNAMLDYTVSLAKSVDAFGDAVEGDGDVGKALEEVLFVVEDAANTWSNRQDVVTGMK